MRYSKQPEESLIPFDVIQSATQGDHEALASVLKHFERDIAQMPTRIFYDEFGQSHCYIDYDLKQRIKCRLMAQIILKFKI